MTRRLLRSGAAAAGTLGLVLVSTPAWALELPVPAPRAPSAPAVLPSQLPAPLASLVPSPVASVLTEVTAAGASPSPSPSPSPGAGAPQPAPVGRPGPAQSAPTRQGARALTGGRVLALPESLPGTAGGYLGGAPLLAAPGLAPVPPAPVLSAPEQVTPQLVPAPSVAASSALSSGASSQGLPALIVAIAIGAVTAAGAGQVAELSARRRGGRAPA